jgi:hypothetical protein
VRNQIEAKRIHIIIGNSKEQMNFIAQIVSDGGVVLTRTWAAAFEYIQGITTEQVTALRNIYNSYFSSSIDIRHDIVEHNFVTWVRAFKFIFELWSGFRTGYFSHVIKALYYFEFIDRKKITPKLIVQIKHLSECVFQGLSDITTDKTTVDVINDFNNRISEPRFSEIKNVLGLEFAVPIFDESDKDDLKNNVSSLDWKTSYKLFTEVFSAESRYMTVHQSKGLEWDKFVLSLLSNTRRDRDNTTLSEMFQNPLLLNEEPAEEFTRMYYVACSRAKEDLYIHLPNNFDYNILEKAISNFSTASGQTIDYEFILS